MDRNTLTLTIAVTPTTTLTVTSTLITVTSTLASVTTTNGTWTVTPSTPRPRSIWQFTTRGLVCLDVHADGDVIGDSRDARWYCTPDHPERNERAVTGTWVPVPAHHLPARCGAAIEMWVDACTNEVRFYGLPAWDRDAGSQLGIDWADWDAVQRQRLSYVSR